MDAYERSLKQQADRIRRELSQEGKKGAPAPKPEPKDEFIPSDVPSPIYGYARPKPKIELPIGHSPETRDDLSVRQARRVAQPVERVADDVPTPAVPVEPKLDMEPIEEPKLTVDETTMESFDARTDELDSASAEELSVEEPVAEELAVEEPSVEELSVEEPVAEEPAVEEPVAEEPSVEELEEIVTEQADVPSEETIISTETTEENPIVSETETTEQDIKPLLGEVSILESGFASVFMGSTELKSSKLAVREEKEDVTEEDVSLEAPVETVAPIVEDVAKTLQSEDTIEVPDEEELTPAMSVTYKAEGPPLNVMMTPQDRMAMYKSRRLAKKNNNL
ncbi:hypothetical protein [Exiguobacterium sp. SL-9]|uniref:hypothetical protein n=1 Tax=Exiguobacterium sp. SL-9 TaxID=2510963 RepID=UPI00103DF9EE|nr:hypothetical protein [Exiguobacterium sp. SL-9]TCI22213.1 hypothetical protein EVJ34_06230 [Exiguobacterium sp. SL-9]